jgi:hypothetical protein
MSLDWGEAVNVQKLATLKGSIAEVERFRDDVVSNRERLAAYVDRLNRLKPGLIWWNHVAHRALREMWSGQETGAGR